MKHIRFHHIITALCCLLLISCGIDKNLKKGEKFLSLGEYYDAADKFKQAYTKTPAKERDNRGKIALKMARCYEKIHFLSVRSEATGSFVIGGIKSTTNGFGFAPFSPIVFF